MTRLHDETADGRGAALLGLARTAITRRLVPEAPSSLPVEAAGRWLDEPGASFVTLTIDGELRGCMGSVRAIRGLREDVTANAVASAFRDPRFPDLAPEELALLRIEVSVLTPPEPLDGVHDEASAVAAVQPGVDGLLLEADGLARATFLPQVWEDLPRPIDFLAHLRRKAGLPERAWHPRWRLLRYSVEKHSE